MTGGSWRHGYVSHLPGAPGVTQGIEKAAEVVRWCLMLMIGLMSFGNPADPEGPVALRPHLTMGLPLVADLFRMTHGPPGVQGSAAGRVPGLGRRGA